MIEINDLQSPGQAAFSFRSILESFARPGSVSTLPEISQLPPGVTAATAALLLALCDFQTPVWLSPALAGEEVRGFLRFYTGAPVTADVAQASFAILGPREFCATYPRLHKGTHEYPDRSATAVVQVNGYEAPQRVRLAGPGIQRDAIVAVAGFGPAEWAMLAEGRASFPLGADVAFTSGTSLMAVPRSVSITTLEDR